jgi:hypothetical protein
MERGMTRGDGAIRGRVNVRWEVGVCGEATQQPSGQEAQEAMAHQEATVQL